MFVCSLVISGVSAVFDCCFPCWFVNYHSCGVVFFLFPVARLCVPSDILDIVLGFFFGYFFLLFSFSHFYFADWTNPKWKSASWFWSKHLPQCVSVLLRHFSLVSCVWFFSFWFYIEPFSWLYLLRTFYPRVGSTSAVKYWEFQKLLFLACDLCILLLSFLMIEEVTYSFTYLFLFLKLLVSSFLRKCRYVGNIHTQVTEPLLQEVFSSTGPVEGCKLIRKEKVMF